MKIVTFLLLLLGVSGSVGAQGPTAPLKLTLAEAIRLAEDRNPAMLEAREFVALAEADVIVAKQRPNPAFSFSSEGLAPGDTNHPAFVNAQQFLIRADQEIETAGRRKLRTDAARLSIEAARARVENQRRQLQFDVRRAYFQTVLARADSDAARASLDDIDQVIAVSRTRFQLGELSGGEMRRLEVERLRFADDVFSADLVLRNARSALLALVGAGRLDQPVETVETLAPPAVPEGQRAEPTAPPVLDAAALRAQAIANRPDLTAARREGDRAASALQLERALRTPNVTAGAGYRRDFGDSGLVVEVSVPLPLLNRNAGGLARADAERRLAATRLAAAETVVALEVQQAINNVEASRTRVAYIEREYLKSAREARDIVLAAFRSGAADLLDYLDAQRAFRESQRTYNRALYEHRMNLFQLDAAVGTPGASAQATVERTGDPQS